MIMQINISRVLFLQLVSAFWVYSTAIGQEMQADTSAAYRLSKRVDAIIRHYILPNANIINNDTVTIYTFAFVIDVERVSPYRCNAKAVSLNDSVAYDLFKNRDVSFLKMFDYCSVLGERKSARVILPCLIKFVGPYKNAKELLAADLFYYDFEKLVRPLLHAQDTGSNTSDYIYLPPIFAMNQIVY